MRRAIGAVVFGLLCGFATQGAAEGAWEWDALFANPPDVAKPWVYWWWLDSNATKEGITKDLEEMKRQGIGGALLFDAGEGHTSPVGPRFMSAEWLALFKHAVLEANRLGMELSFNICSGWNAGGTWVTPEHAIKRVTWDRTWIQGPLAYGKELRLPPVTDGHYKDLSVIAYRLPIDSLARMDEAGVSMSVSSMYQLYAADRTTDLDASTRWISNGDRPGMGPTEAKPEYVQFDLPEPFAAVGIHIVPYSECGPKDCQLQTSQDGTAFETIARFTLAGPEPATESFAETTAKSFRLLITSSYPTKSGEDVNVQISEVQLLANGEAPQDPIPGGLDLHSAVNLTERMDASGRLMWDVPEGAWCVFRFGETIHGKYEGHRKTKCASRGAQGYEIDFYSREALDMHFAETAQKVLAEAGDLAGKTLRYFHDDSWECTEPTWTPRMLDEFKARFGYDPLVYFPALSGQTVQSPEITARFLRDFYRTTADLMANNHYGRLRELSRISGMGIHSEAGGPFFVATMDPLMNLGRDDIPMGEYWIRRHEPDGAIAFADQYSVCDTVKQAASAAHVYGKKLCQAEAFTNMGRNWEEAPSMLKDIADRAFCAGLTRNVLCFYVHQPYLDIKPGYEWPEAGTHFDRNITWWDQMDAFTSYLSRCQFLLQQGLFVADVCYFAGDDAGRYVPAKTHMNPALPDGYDCDTVNGEILMTRLSVQDGRLVLPDGMSYRLLVLPERDSMTPEALAKVAALVESGATVVGPKPILSSSLKNYPACDDEVKSLAETVWGNCDGTAVKEHAHGKGRVITGRTLQDVLEADGLLPDVEFKDAQGGASLDYIHRRTPDADIYFVSNQKDRSEHALCVFRVNARRPELWDPLTGGIRITDAFTQTNDGRTAVPLEFAPCGSMFVVFRTPIAPSQKGTAAVNFPAVTSLMEIQGPWKVSFDTKWGGPDLADFPELIDWTKRPEEGIKFYSGKATYRTDFDVAESVAHGNHVYLDLGELYYLAQVRLNGKALGVLWTKPFRVEITEAMHAGTNQLEVDIVNLWPNRLIGDAKLPPDKRYTTTNVDKFYKGEHPLLPSGLIGPVTLLSSES